ISKVGTIFSGTWKGTPLLNDRVPSLDGIRSPINNVGMAGKRLTGLANPVDPQDAVTKAFMDLLLQGLNPKAAVRCASTLNVTRRTLLRPVDDVPLLAGDRVLLKNQSNPSENGIWIAATGAWTRSTDADIESELLAAYCGVLEGTVNAGSGWIMITP